MHYAEFAEDEVCFSRLPSRTRRWHSCSLWLSSTRSKNTRTTSGKKLARKLGSLQKSVDLGGLFLNPCADIYVGMRAICQGAFQQNIRLVGLRRSFGSSIEALIALRSEIWHASITAAATRLFTYNPRWQARFFLVHLKVFNSINGAAASGYGAGGEFFYFDSVLHARPLIHKIFDSSLNGNGLIWLHDDWKGCVFLEGLLHVWDWILWLGN